MIVETCVLKVPRDNSTENEINPTLLIASYPHCCNLSWPPVFSNTLRFQRLFSVFVTALVQTLSNAVRLRFLHFFPEFDNTRGVLLTRE